MKCAATFTLPQPSLARLLPKTRIESALEVAEAIRQAIANIAKPGLPGFTVSIGVARHLPDESLGTLFRRVDKALYRAKNKSHNEVLPPEKKQKKRPVAGAVALLRY